MKFIKHLKDVIRFNQLPAKDRQICFYCEGKNYWPHLQPILDALLESTEVTINYVTSSDDDPALMYENSNLNTFVIGEGFIRNYFFENLASELVIMTMPDLDQYQVKKSPKVKKFIYIHHSLVSHHMVYRPKAFDAFDVIFCSGPHHNQELTAMVEEWQIPPKLLVDHGYGRLDSIIKNRRESTNNDQPVILVAPTWGEHGTIEQMGEALINALMAMPYRVILRPHPQTVKLAKPVIDRIVKKHQSNPQFTYEFGVSSEESLHQSDVMISDWSGAALEYAFGLFKPVLFIDVPKKVQNPDHQSLSVTPFEVSIREHIGVVQSTDLKGLESNIEQLLNANDNHAERLEKLSNQHVHHLGNSGQVAAQAIMELL